MVGGGSLWRLFWGLGPNHHHHQQQQQHIISTKNSQHDRGATADLL